MSATLHEIDFFYDPISPYACLAFERLPQAQGSLTERYRDPAQRIVGAALLDRDGYAKLTHLTTRIGHRLSGSEGLERAIEWASGAMKAEGLTTRTQPVLVPHWVRGRESLEVQLGEVRATLWQGPVFAGIRAAPAAGVSRRGSNNPGSRRRTSRRCGPNTARPAAR